MSKSTLKPRIITALLLAPVLLLLVIYGQSYFGFVILIAVLQLTTTYEWLKICQLNPGLAAVNALVITLLTLLLVQVWPLSPNIWAIGYGLIWLLAVCWLRNHRWGYENHTMQVLSKGLLGVLAIMVFAMGMHHLFALPDGQWWTLSLFFLIWVADIGAYVSGKTMGKHKLAINISPGKTWEGVIGASIFVALYAIIISQMLPIVWWHAVLMMVPIAWISVVGDLAASLGKRQAKVKDSSNLLPGHGGFIDRFDSLIAAAPVYAYLLPELL